jgi:hypothetical protein
LDSESINQRYIIYEGLWTRSQLTNALLFRRPHRYLLIIDSDWLILYFLKVYCKIMEEIFYDTAFFRQKRKFYQFTKPVFGIPKEYIRCRKTSRVGLKTEVPNRRNKTDYR